ncbi:RDD family protein [Thiohalorhabdus sp.]|uniref:RDD family protein n=1 Tax=Thiohalorhabdus sp. TaxID=3094134 RepID=UPI002FC3444A
MSQPISPSPYLLRRLGAATYDALICAALVMAVGLASTALTGGANEDMRGPGPVGRTLVQLALLAAPPAYFLGSWVRGGQTVGMRPWRLRVVDPAGGAISLKAAGIRLLTALLSWAPLGLGFWWALIDPDRLTWHDRLSRTHLMLTGKGVSTPSR